MLILIAKARIRNEIFLISRDRCYDFLKYFRQKNGQKMAFLTQNKAKLCKNLKYNIGFREKSQFFRQKISKIAENCDHNIDPSVSTE
jgi:hypothetical protein